MVSAGLRRLLTVRLTSVQFIAVPNPAKAGTLYKVQCMEIEIPGQAMHDAETDSQADRVA